MASPIFATSPPVVLDFAHSDPTSGGGLQGDLLTLASLGVHPLTVLTALTIQDTSGFSGIQAIDAEWVEDQARALLEDIGVAAFKVGLLAGVDQVSVVAGILSDYDDIPLVLHPGPTRLMHGDGVDDEIYEALRDLLLPQVSLLVADPAEAARLLGDDDGDEAADAAPTPDSAGVVHAATAAALLADRILATGCQAVLLTGVASRGGGSDNLLFADGGLRFTQPRATPAGDLCGSGETLAAALAGCLAGGAELLDAVRSAHEYTAGAVAAGFRPGMGRILPDRLFWARPTPESLDAE